MQKLSYIPVNVTGFIMFCFLLHVLGADYQIHTNFRQTKLFKDFGFSILDCFFELLYGLSSQNHYSDELRADLISVFPVLKSLLVQILSALLHFFRRRSEKKSFRAPPRQPPWLKSVDSQNCKFPENKHPGSRIGSSQTGPKSMFRNIRIHNLAFKLATLPETGFGHTNFSRLRKENVTLLTK